MSLRDWLMVALAALLLFDCYIWRQVGIAIKDLARTIEQLERKP